MAQAFAAPFATHADRDAIAEFTLRAGSVLYLPAGAVHTFSTRLAVERHAPLPTPPDAEPVALSVRTAYAYLKSEMRVHLRMI